jgi:hypothetical protein
LGACSSQTALARRISETHPSTCVAILGQPGWSHKYSVSASSRPSGFVRPVFMVTAGMENPPTASSFITVNYLTSRGILRKLVFVAPTEVIRSTALAGRSGPRSAQVPLLPPVSPVKHPATSTSNVTGRDPNHTGAWRTHPLSTYPHIAIARPALVSADPDVSSTRSVANHTHSNRRRRHDANHSLRNSHSRKK